MKAFYKDFWLRYSFLIVCVGLIIVAAITIARHTANRQAGDPRLIILASRENMLAERITQLAGLIEQESQEEKFIVAHSDTLKKNLERLRGLHLALIGSSHSRFANPHTDSLLQTIGTLVEQAYTSGEILVNHSDLPSQKMALNNIRSATLQLNIHTHALVSGYREHAESSINDLKRVIVGIGVASFIALVGGFVSFLYPFVRKLKAFKLNITNLHEELQASNQQLQITEEEINSLQGHLASKEQQYRELIDNAQDMIYEIDNRGIFTFVNPTLEHITGIRHDKLVGEPFWKMIREDYRDSVVSFYQDQVTARRERSYSEFPIVSASKKTIWIGQNAHFFFNDKGASIRANFISRDITHLKEIQEKLTNSEKLYRLLSTNSQDLISLYSNTGDEPIRIYVSPSVKTVLGYESEDVLLRTPFEFVHPDDTGYVNKEIESAARGEIVYVEYRARKKNGSFIWMESSSQPFFNDEGQQIGFQTSARDITQRKETESRLKEAKEKAEEATRAKSQFLSMISHEIRTPMNAVIGLTNFLLDEKPREDQLKHLKLLKFSGKNLLAIINDILDFNKIEAGMITLENIPFEFRSFIDNVLETLVPRASDKGVPLVLEYDENLPAAVKGDPFRLQQVLNNLVDNAIKFTDTGFVHVVITVSEKRDDKYLVQFRIQDTGIGISPDKLQSIFEPFTQASTDTSRKFGGSGLGLAITRRMLELMGAEIHAESETGKGSTFRFTLSLEEASYVQEDKPANKNMDYSRLDHAHLLLVEDNDVNQIVATNYLNKWGFQVTVANNGREAVDKIRQQAFHLVLMDLQMPDLDGYEAAQLIRKMPDTYFQEVPIIALTASAMTEDIHHLQDIGFNDYVIKPFDPHELEEKIYKYLLTSVPLPKVEAPSAQTLFDSFWGVDLETNVDLARRIVKNIQSLQQSFTIDLENDDVEAFNRTCHKMKTTISILKDKALTDDLEDLRKAMRIKAELTTQLQSKVDRLADCCNRKIEELNRFIEETSV